MNISNRKIFHFKSTLYGVVLGILVILAYLIIELIARKAALTVDSILSIIKNNYLFLFIGSSPILLGSGAYFLVKYLFHETYKMEDKINKNIANTNKILDFIKRLNNDELDVKLEVDDDNNELAKNIIQFQDKIKKGAEEEKKRREEDSQINWTAEGLAMFGEILRKDNDDLSELSYNIINNLVKYLNANQGGLFLINDENPDNLFIEQMASYAYERKKFADKELKWGEGMIGTCIMEKETIHIKKVPDNYLFITSGLGKANPNQLLIIPLKVNEDVHGAIEIASFQEFSDYMVTFVEKVADSIATTVANVKINLKTSTLLEETREQSEAMKSQEEEIRQNLEELQATQEEAKRQSEEFISFANSVNHTMIRAEYKIDGTLIYANTKFLNKLGYSKNSEVEGQHISMFINLKDRDWFNDIWETLADGGKHFEGYMKHVTKDGQDMWTMATYTCVRNEAGLVKKILFLSLDTTELKKQSIDFKGQLDALNRANIKAEFFTSGEVLDCNRKFRDTFKYALVDVYEKQVFEFLHKDEKQKFEDHWTKIIKGKPIEGVFKMISSEKEDRWLRGTFSPVYDMYNDIAKIIFVANDITNEKLMEIQTKQQSEILKAQEEKLKQSEQNLTLRLKETREAVRQQFKEIEKVKVLNEKTLEGALDAILTITQEGRIIFFNKAAEEIWGISRTKVLHKNISILFNEEQQEKNEFIKKFVTPGHDKMVGIRQEISIVNNKGEELPVLILLSQANVENEFNYTAFIQNISVDLF
ncbi:PAS domain S-box protein [Bacteroidota bacterium]